MLRVVLPHRFIMDMYVFLLFLLSNTSLELFGGVFCQSQEIIFNLKDPESNEVISLGQENVALVCHITNTANANITIRNVAGESVATNMNAGNCLEHTISRLAEEDNGNYVCQIQYLKDGSTVTTEVEESLLLNVESGDQQCFRNGTTNQAFGIGDTLLLSCYCTSTINCNWISTVVDSNIGESIPVYDKVEFAGNKRIIRVIVGPLFPKDTNTRYDCYYGSLSEQRCDIGPTTTSSNDFVLNAVNPRTILRECPRSDASSVTPVVPGNTTREDDETETTTPTLRTPTSEQGETTTIRPEEISFLIYIIIAVVLFILFLLVIILIIIVFCRRRKKKGNEGDGLQKSMKKSPNNNMAYDASDAVRTGGDPGEHIDQPLPDVISHDDNSPYGVSGVSGLRNVRDNGSADPKEVQYASVNRHKMAEVSHYGLRSAVLVDQEYAEEEDDEEFFSGEVTEYRVPVAFRAEEDFEISHGGENFDAQELPLRYS